MTALNHSHIVTPRLAWLVTLLLLNNLASPLFAKPTAIEYSRDLETLSRALQSIHPAPWRHQIQQKFRDGLTQNPSMLNNYPLGPWLSISKALKGLDRTQQDSITGINLLQQQIDWRLLPITLGQFEGGLYIIAADEPYADYIGQQLRAVNGQSPELLLRKLQNYFPEFVWEWLPQYLRITEVLGYLGAPCQETCILELSGKKLSIPSKKLLQDRKVQAELKPVQLVRYFWQKTEEQETVRQFTSNSMYWRLSGKALQASRSFAQSQRIAEGFMRSQAVTNIILDFRAIDAVTPSLVNELWNNIRQMPATNPHRTIYCVVDKSTGLLINDLLSRMQQMPEVVFVGQPLGLHLSHYYDPKVVQLKKTGLNVTVASRFEKYLNTEATGPFRPAHNIQWLADDFFSGSDTVLNAILDLIEINSPD